MSNLDNKSDSERLKDTVTKKFNTANIFPLSEFERMFGDMIGVDVDSEHLTREQEKNLRLWQSVRKNILDNGNKQRRAVLSEIDKYEIRAKRYVTEFIIKESDRNA